MQITAFAGWGSTGRIAVGIYDALKADGDACVIAWGRKNATDNLYQTIKIGNKQDQLLHVLYTRITDKCGFSSKRVTKEFIEKIDQYQPDIVQLHIIHGYYINLDVLFSYLQKKDIPVVWTFHDCWAFTGHCPYFDVANCNRWKSGCFKCPQKHHHPASYIKDNSSWNWNEKRKLFTSLRNLTIVTPSDWLAGLVNDSFFKSKVIKVINNGIDLNVFKKKRVPDATYQKYLIPQDKLIVLGVSSSWAPSKGLNDFVEVSKQLSKEYQVVLVGINETTKKKLTNNNIITINRTDNVNDLADFYNMASVFVNPTYEDNYPTTNLEAMACGTPVITYNTGGSVEPILRTGYGEVVPKGNIKQLVNEIIEISKMPKKSIDTDFLDERLKFKEYVDLYKQILKEK